MQDYVFFQVPISYLKLIEIKKPRRYWRGHKYITSEQLIAVLIVQRLSLPVHLMATSLIGLWLMIFQILRLPGYIQLLLLKKQVIFSCSLHHSLGVMFIHHPLPTILCFPLLMSGFDEWHWFSPRWQFARW